MRIRENETIADRAADSYFIFVHIFLICEKFQNKFHLAVVSFSSFLKLFHHENSFFCYQVYI